MSKLSTSVDVVDAMRGVVLHVDFKRAHELNWRIWFGMKLIWLATWVMNCSVEYEGISSDELHQP